MAQSFKTGITVDDAAAASSQAIATNVNADTHNRLTIDAGGKITWGSGSGTGDTTLYRDSANTLKTDDSFTATSLAVTGAFTLPTSDGSADQVITTNGSGTLSWADQSGGATVSDTAPGSPSDGDFWYESDTGKTFVYYDSYWVEVGGSASSSKVLEDVDSDTKIQIEESSDEDKIRFDTAGLERMIIDASGNVGIGTSSPSRILDIEDATNAIIGLNDSGGTVGSNTNSRIIFEAGGATAGQIGFQNTSSGILGITNSDGPLYLTTSSADDILFRTNSSTAMTVKSGGNVGIGTTSPETPLNIVTTNKLGSTFTGTTDGEGLRVDQSDYSAGNYVSLVEASYDDGQTEPHVRIGAMFDGSGSHLAFGTSNSFGNGITNTALFIGETGKVGIGTTAPDDLLHVEGDTPTLLVADTGNNYAQDNIQGEILLKGRYHSGTADPTANAYSAAAIRSFKDNSDGSGGAGMSLWTSASGTGGLTQKMTIDKDGKVGIGTTGPSDMLDVGTTGNEGSFRVHAAEGAESFRVVNDIVRAASIKNITTGLAANVYISTANATMYRSTSSIKYKTNVETMGDSFADAILGLRPVWYRSLGQDDPDSWGYWGFIAEEVAEVDPRLVSFGVPTDYERQYDEDGEPIDPDVADLTEPEGVQYDRMVPHLVNLAKRQQDTIEALEQRITALEAD